MNRPAKAASLRMWDSHNRLVASEVTGLIYFVLTLPLLLVCASQSVCGATVSTGTFDDGNKLYEQKQYSKALRAYEGLIHQGSISPAILFNAGNAAFKSKQLGHAIVRYREAQRFAPRDPDIQANLKFARNAAGNPERGVNFAERFSRVFTLNELTVLVSSALWLWFGLLALREWKPQLRPALRGYTILSGIVFCGLALWLAVAVGLVLNDRSAVVVANEAAARLGPLDESQVAFTLRDGTEVEVLAARSGWMQVKDLRGRRGWVAENNIERLPALAKAKAG